MMRKHISLLVSALVMTMAVSAQAGEVSVLGGLDMTGLNYNTVPAGMTWIAPHTLDKNIVIMCRA